MKNSPPPRFVRLAVLFALGAGTYLHSNAAVDPAALVTKASVSVLLGQPVERVVPVAESKDEDTGGMIVYCTYHAGKNAVIVSVVSFVSAREAQAKMTEQQAAARLDGENAKITAEPGLGDRAFWATTDEGAEFVVIKGARVLGLAVGGRLPRAPASYHDALRKLAVDAVAKL